MKIAITGGRGLIGRALLDRLPASADVAVLSRHPEAAELPGLRSGIAVHATDYDESSLTRIFRDRDAVVHLAARRPGSANDESCRDNVGRDFAVFSACEACQIPNVVFASSRGVYGVRPAPWRETTPPRPETVYGLAKVQSERAAEDFNRRGLAIKSLRLAQILGWGEREGSMVATFLRQASERQTLSVRVSDGLVREYVYVKDVAEAILAALRHPDRSGVFNVGSGETTTIRGLAERINAAFGNAGNLRIEEPLTDIREHSLMDSAKFCETFAWAPRWTLATAIADLATRA